MSRELLRKDFPAEMTFGLSAGDLGWISGSGRSPGEGNDNPPQHSCLENPMLHEEPGRLQSRGLQRVAHDWATKTHFLRRREVDTFLKMFSVHIFLVVPGLHCCKQGLLSNPRIGGAWWAAISVVAQSRTRLKQLSSSSFLLQWLFFLDFPGGPVVRSPPASAGDMGLIPGPGRFHMQQCCMHH